MVVSAIEKNKEGDTMEWLVGYFILAVHRWCLWTAVT